MGSLLFAKSEQKAGASRPERRAHHREALAGELTWGSASGGPVRDGRLVDVSACGAAFETTGSPCPLQGLRIRARMAGDPTDRRGLIARVVKTGDETYLVGAQFESSR